MVIPSYDMIQCSSASFAFPRVLLLCIGLSSRATQEVFEFVVCRAYIPVKRLCVFPPTAWMCTVQITLHYDTIVFLFGDPILRRGAHICLPRGIGGSKLIYFHELYCDPCRCLCLCD